jgi:hypothetical protein
VWCGGGGPDLRPRTVARVEQSVTIEEGYGLLVEIHPLRLAHHRTVPVESKGPEVGELCLLHARTYPRVFEILHAHQKPSPGRTREKPRQESGPQVPEVERARGTRRKAPVGEALLPVPSLLWG